MARLYDTLQDLFYKSLFETEPGTPEDFRIREQRVNLWALAPKEELQDYAKRGQKMFKKDYKTLLTQAKQNQARCREMLHDKSNAFYTFQSERDLKIVEAGERGDLEEILRLADVGNEFN